MKRVIFFLSLMVALVSCKKKHSCSCYYNLSGVKYYTTNIEGSKKEAASKCQSLTYNSKNDYEYRGSCSLD